MSMRKSVVRDGLLTMIRVEETSPTSESYHREFNGPRPYNKAVRGRSRCVRAVADPAARIKRRADSRLFQRLILPSDVSHRWLSNDFLPFIVTATACCCDGRGTRTLRLRTGAGAALRGRNISPAQRNATNSSSKTSRTRTRSALPTIGMVTWQRRKSNFDYAVDLMLSSGVDLKSDPELKRRIRSDRRCREYAGDGRPEGRQRA